MCLLFFIAENATILVTVMKIILLSMSQQVMHKKEEILDSALVSAFVLISFVICNQLLSTCKSMSFHIGWRYCRYAKVQVEKLEIVVQFLHLHSEV